ncbi:terminase family protein [Salmonella enterica]|nr:terminase family protein [Salmonella enterica]
MRFTTPEYRQNLLAAARALSNSTMEDIRNNLDVIEAAVTIKEQWKVEGFLPYEFQQRWFDSGLNHRLRYLSAANRIGKSFGAAAEFSYHATGLYPEWWRGYRVTNELITTARVLWAIGVSADSTRTTIQLELLGTDDARQRHLFGTGSIPRERINMDSFVCDGQAVRSFRVYHASGEESTCRLYSAMQDEKVFMGQAIVYAWIDEQSPKEDALVAQAQTRTMTTDGVVAVTATPEHGETDLYTRCRDDLSGEIFFQKASWDDAPHFTEEKITEQLALTPYYQRDMRRHGEPVLGVGKIYPFSPDAITCAPFAIPDHWLVVAALDFGYTGESDPSVIVFVAYDRDTGRRYIFSEWHNPAIAA